MTGQTSLSRPPVQQASAPYTYEERIGNRWAPTLLYTAGVASIRGSRYHAPSLPTDVCGPRLRHDA